MKFKNLFFLAALGLTASATLTSCEDILGHWEKPTPVTPTPSGSEEGSVPGLLPGKFTINASGDQVQFSQGNLQATYDGSEWTWKFAEHQWDYIGGTSSDTDPGATTNNKINGNGTVSVNGTVDLFGWVGTTTSFADAPAIYGISNSATSDDYGTSTSDALKSDWGKTIDPSGTTWRTLTGGTGGEWEWILGPGSSPNPGTNCRTSSTIGSTANARFAKAKLFNTTYGIILFPDSYTHPDGVADPTGINDTGNTSWGANTYSAADWEKMETAGAVFLPAAGYRNGTMALSVGSRGNYWSSTADGAGYAYCVGFNLSSMGPAVFDSRYRGFSVRLVRPAE